MKNTRQQSLRLFTMVDRCLRWFTKPPSTPRSGLNHRQQWSTARRAGYTLIEVLAAGAIISIGTTAMVSLSSTLMLQEELATRVAVTRNYQENMVRLWQLGLSTVQITALMPSQAQNALLQQAVFGSPTFIESGLTTINGVVMETALCTAIVNLSQNPATETAGASFTLTAYRPRLITDLRTLPP
ncbi:prepilin-type N-terminal cleavage/methylation domain-containing protein [Prosthecobacter sp.]|uniref:type IV pilus modification PilV family protein n=1 Tax=Prosthecobacter sp. TaxID=1965333 RepID=UPI002ABA32AD|nr:prepilin-type N-terminal cleavage/methylation domain-containing protein [Prosthecobacter sp.]MDZ4404814.1 prepilin-type N-terminal cleavage/methylation domain-containing protein [Prosthecobacter sp.]